MDTVKKKIHTDGKNYLVKIEKIHDSRYHAVLYEGFFIAEGIAILFMLCFMLLSILIIDTMLNATEDISITDAIVPLGFAAVGMLFWGCREIFSVPLKSMDFELGEQCSFQDMCETITGTYRKEQEQEQIRISNEASKESEAKSRFKSWDGKINK